MISNLISTFTKTTISCMGDSLTDLSPFYGVRPSRMWPAQLSAALVALGASVKARNFGVGGNTTCQMLGRFSQMTNFDVPDVGIVFGGVNDPGRATTVNGAGATTTNVPVQAGAGAFLLGGYVTINGETRLVTANNNDTLTLDAPLSNPPASGAAVAIATQKNIEAMIDALYAAGCQRSVVVSAHYLNFSAGGDTQAVPYATYVPVRAAQTAAAASRAAKGAVFCDLYAYMKNLIATGIDVQGSNSWHAINNNQHLNDYGQSVVSAAVLATVQAQAGWVAALK